MAYSTHAIDNSPTMYGVANAAITDPAKIGRAHV